MQRRFEQILIGLGALFYLFVFPHGIHGDGTPRYQTLETLLTTGTWADMKYPMIGPLFAAPFYFLGYVAKNHHWWVSRYNSFLFLAFVYFAWRFLRADLGRDSARRFVLILMTGAMFARHAADFYGEMFTVLGLGLGTLALHRRREALGAVLIALGVANTPAAIAGAGFAVGMLALWQRRIQILAAVPLAAAIFFLENWLRRGSPLDSGRNFAQEVVIQTIQPYSGVPGFGYPLGFGLLSILFSFGKGLVFFTPGLFILPWALAEEDKSIRRIAYAWAACVAGLVLIYAKWNAWYGAWFWGPRFFLFASVLASLALACWLGAKKRTPLHDGVLLVLLTLSVWVGASGIAFGMNNMDVCAREMEYVCLYVPEFSPLWRPFIMEKGLNGKQTAFLIFHFLAWIALAYPLLQRLGEGTFRIARASRLR